MRKSSEEVRDRADIMVLVEGPWSRLRLDRRRWAEASNFEKCTRDLGGPSCEVSYERNDSILHTLGCFTVPDNITLTHTHCRMTHTGCVSEHQGLAGS